MIGNRDIQNLHIVNHPLVLHKLSHLRNESTPTSTFRALLREIALLIGYEITRELEMAEHTVQTPVAKTIAPVLKGKKPAIVPILRAGLGMAEGLEELLPTAPIGHIGLYRDPNTQRPVEYYVRLPENKDRVFILVDPMLATGYSASYAVDMLNKYNIPDERIKFMAMVAAPEGMDAFNKRHSNVQVWAAALDEKLNDKAYIVPGLGDAGDRLFGTL
ncbi:MAG: uracil phosphoribosyltransferase [Rhodospirillaceae bacterium]|nr:uracil phosphoribosyltransferase [Rhodospirillaceae bacterium]|tara:strand:+ start:174 stop:824 length:651 start_codon:yes stop_codon:yes gene_type:complete